MIRDQLGREFDFARPPQRVVSLVPSLTETLFELGAGESVAGITDFCIFPPGLTLPRLGGTKNPSVEKIRALQPDLVYVNLEENLKKHADAIEEFAPVFTTEPKSVADVRTLITTLGTIHQTEAKARSINEEIAEGGRRKPDGSFSFLVAIWKNPWMWCGGDTYVSDLVETVGGRNLLGHQKRYPEMDLECALALQPEYIFLPDEPYLFTKEDAAAIDGPRVVGPFPGHLFTWHGARTRDGLRYLRDVMS
jgi:ABC-type Fe3+-hydroxamate transport system substrate-binding protein